MACKVESRRQRQGKLSECWLHSNYKIHYLQLTRLGCRRDAQGFPAGGWYGPQRNGGQLSQVKPSWPHDGKPHSERPVAGSRLDLPRAAQLCSGARRSAAKAAGQARIFKTSECRPAVVAGGKLFHKGERENVAYSRVTRLPDATCKTSFTERIWETIVGTEESASNSGASATRLFLLQTSSLNTPFVHNKRNKNLRSWNFCTQDPWCRIRLIGFDPRATFPSNLHGAGF